MSGIPLVDLKAQYASIKPEIDAAIADVLDNTAFILGERVTRFEEAWAEACGVAHAVGVGNGTDALVLALSAMGLAPGDEIITTPHTFIATTEAICQVGAKPVFVDVDPDRGLMDPALIDAAVTPRTKAILPVHLYGHPCDMAPIVDIAEARGLQILEDAAQAHLATYRGKGMGGFGRAACFSFYPGKNLGAYGDAGAVVTNDAALAAKLRLMRNHGRSDKYLHVNRGVNSRLDGLQAAVLSVKLPHLAAWTEARRRAAALYTEKLRDVPGLRLPKPASDCEPVWHLYVLRVANRDAVLARLKEAEIFGGVHYPLALHLQPAHEELGHQRNDFPKAEDWADNCLSLPLFPEITEAQIERVAAVLREALVKEPV